MISTTELQGLIDQGADVVTRDGDKVGSIGQIYVDEATGDPTWVTVKTGLFGTSESFVPVDAATVREGALSVPYDKATVKDAPRVDPDGRISREEEDDLYRHYGLQQPAHWTEGSPGTAAGTTGTAGTAGTAAGTAGAAGAAGGAAGTADTGRHTDTGRQADSGAGTAGTAGTAGRHTTTGGGDDASVVRSEEQVDVGTRTREAGRVRLRKYEVTENVTKTVPVTREEVRVEREPVTDADATDTGRDEAEVTLHEDEVVVDKKDTPVERVSLGTETVTDEETVTENVRKEHVETEADPDTRR